MLQISFALKDDETFAGTFRSATTILSISNEKMGDIMEIV